MFDNTIKFKYSWRPYQEQVLKDVMKHIRDKKIHIVAAPRFWKNCFRIRISKIYRKTCFNIVSNTNNKKSMDR